MTLSAVLHEELLHGKAFVKPGRAVPVLTVDPLGWPHVAMVSGVSLNAAGTTLSFPIRKNTRTWRHIIDNGKVTLLIGLSGIVAYVKGEVHLASLEDADALYDVCQLQIHEVQEDVPPGVAVEGFIYRFVDMDPNEVEERRVFLRLCGEEWRAGTDEHER